MALWRTKALACPFSKPEHDMHMAAERFIYQCVCVLVHLYQGCTLGLALLRARGALERTIATVAVFISTQISMELWILGRTE